MSIAPQHLKVHLESILEKVCYLCNLCENTFTTKEHLKRQTQSIYISRGKHKVYIFQEENKGLIFLAYAVLTSRGLCLTKFTTVQ